MTAMINAQPLSLTTSAANLKRLAMIRLILIFALLAALLFAKTNVSADFIHPALLTVLAIFTLVNMLTFWRLQQAWPVTDLEYFCQLLFDIIGLTVMLYVSGGASNPFVSYYLVPITISAALLPWRYTWVISGLSLAAYTLMLFYYQPLPAFQPEQGAHHHHMASGSPNLHILGMWLTFALSTVLITYFVVLIANALRQQQRQQAQDREDILRDEQILAVATLAAGTAHELGTPLSTMILLLDELLTEHQSTPHLTEDLRLLRQQVERCKAILSGLTHTAEIRSHQKKQAVNAREYCQQLIDHWQVIRPEAQLETQFDQAIHQRTLWVDPTLEQAISNLLNNAADACSEQTVHVNIYTDEQSLVIEVRDHGPGIPMKVAEKIGKPFVSTKGKGLGLGLFLSHATIDRYGGSIALYNHSDGGTVAELRLPLSPGSKKTTAKQQ